MVVVHLIKEQIPPAPDAGICQEGMDHSRNSPEIRLPLSSGNRNKDSFPVFCLQSNCPGGMPGKTTVDKDFSHSRDSIGIHGCTYHNNTIRMTGCLDDLLHIAVKCAGPVIITLGTAGTWVDCHIIGVYNPHGFPEVLDITDHQPGTAAGLRVRQQFIIGKMPIKILVHT